MENLSTIFDDVFNLYWDNESKFKLYDKQTRTRDIVLYMLNRTQQAFVWHGLPDTIPQHNLESLLQIHGNACITEVENVPEGRGEKGLYAFFGGLGGLPNAYYEPTIYTIANPYLEFNKMLEIGKDCVRVRNDKFSVGLIPMFTKYGSMMNENEISMNMLSICYRIDNLISADDDRTFESAKEYLNDIVKGQFGVISSSEFFDGIRNDKANGSGKTIKDLIEYEQYIKASWYNEIGLNSNYNMKRERMVASESEMNDDALIPLIDNMLSWRLKAVEDIKEMYGDRYNLDKLSVELNRVWDLDKMYFDIMPESDEQPEESEETTIEREDEKTEQTDEETATESTDELEPTDELDASEETTTPVSSSVEPEGDEISERSENESESEKVINIDINISTDKESEGVDDDDEKETN